LEGGEVGRIALGALLSYYVRRQTAQCQPCQSITRVHHHARYASDIPISSNPSTYTNCVICRFFWCFPRRPASLISFTITESGLFPASIGGHETRRVRKERTEADEPLILDHELGVRRAPNAIWSYLTAGRRKIARTLVRGRRRWTATMRRRYLHTVIVLALYSKSKQFIPVQFA